MVICTCNTSAQKAEEGKPLGAQGHPGLPGEFQASLNNVSVLCLKTKRDKDLIKVDLNFLTF